MSLTFHCRRPQESRLYDIKDFNLRANCCHLKVGHICQSSGSWTCLSTCWKLNAVPWGHGFVLYKGKLQYRNGIQRGLFRSICSFFLSEVKPTTSPSFLAPYVQGWLLQLHAHLSNTPAYFIPYSRPRLAQNSSWVYPEQRGCEQLWDIF